MTTQLPLQLVSNRDADLISYDNGTSGLTATDLQAAIDELDAAIDADLGGDVVGPGSSTDNAIARFDLATGKLLQNSGVLIDDSDNITGVNDLTIGGDLTVNGTTTTVDTTNMNVEDPLVQLGANNNTTDTLDLGFVALYDTSGSQDLYAGVFRDATDNKWKMFVDSQEDLSAATTINTAATGYTKGTLVADLEGNVTGTVSDISNFDTDDLSEGATNKYASTVNVDSAGAVMETDFNAFTVLAADTDNTPAALTLGASTILARLSTGGIVAATPAQIRTELNVEDGATADQSDAEIKTAYENNADTNAFTDADESKLDGIEAGAQVNLNWTSTRYVDPTDFTAGITTQLTLPSAAPSDDEDHVRPYFHGLLQEQTEWSIVGTTITFTSAIPVGVTDVEIHVLA